MTYFRVFAALMISAAALSSRADAQAECRRPAARQATQGETVVLTETKTFPCRIVFANTPVALRGDADPAITDIGKHVARGPDGRFYTNASKGADVHVWNANGQLLRVFGREGSGPGEFARSGKYIGFNRDGNIYISDNNRRWSIFSPALEFIKTVPTAVTGAGFLTNDGLFVATARTGKAFGVFDFAKPATDGSPGVVREFGTPIMRTSRVVTPSTGANFWAAPRDGPGAAYELELWRTDGTLLRTIRRNVPWFPAAGAEPSSEIEILNDDGTGILLVGLMIPNAEKFVDAGKETDASKRRANQDAAIDIYFEAIDGNAGVVLASWGPFHPSAAMKTLPIGFFPRSRTGYRLEENADGFEILRMVELKLVAN